MRLTLDALLVIDAIDRQGSFAAAADSLHRVPSAITYTVQKLEQDLGVNLFDRSGHRARLTPAGRRLLNDGRHLLRAADKLEQTVRHVATGWETQLRIAVADLVLMDRLYPLLAQFYQDEPGGIQLRIEREIFGGTWDALVGGRADLVIGASGEGPPGGGYMTRPMGEIEFVFALSPNHPLASLPEPLSNEDLLKHRAVASADTSRNLPPRTSALLTGQDVLTLPDMQSKLQAQCLGLGVGYLPRRLVEPELSAGRLVVREVEAAPPRPRLSLAWRPDGVGRALQWFLDRLADPQDLAQLVQ